MRLKGLLSPLRDHEELFLADALGGIELFVRLYREPANPSHDDSSLWRQHLHAERKKLDKIYEKAIELATEIRGCEMLDHYIHFEALLGALDDFASFAVAERSRLLGKRGPKTPREFVGAIIDSIEEYTGSKVERTNNRIVAGTPLDVVHKIVAIMDPEIGSGTIDEAIKTRSKARGEVKRRKR